MYGQRYGTRLTPFNMTSHNKYQPEEIQDKLLRFHRRNQPVFLEIEGRRIPLAVDDFSLAARVACAYHMGVTNQVTDSDDDRDSGDEDGSENESEFEHPLESPSDHP